MRNLWIGLAVGLAVSNLVWVTVTFSGNGLTAPPDQDPIAAYHSIGASLDRGALDNVKPNALAIARFFSQINPLIEGRAAALAASDDLPTARRRYRALAESLLVTAPLDTPQGHEL
ncbi:MAG: hypothetical protein AAF654_14470 [Myxococcota bacterium]